MSTSRIGYDVKYDIKRTKDEVRSARNIVIAVAVFSLIISVVAVVLAGIAYSYIFSPSNISVSQPFPTSPNPIYITSAANPITLILPNDMTPYVGNVYRVWSETAQPHTVSISAGTLTSTFTGGATLATFGGAIGEGFVFEVISSSRAVIWTVNGVTFT